MATTVRPSGPFDDSEPSGAAPVAVVTPAVAASALAASTVGAPAAAARARGLSAGRTFDSLRSRAYRWFLISSMGWFGAMNMQMLVRGYLVFDLTGSYAALGTIALANSIPGLAMTVAGGLAADRFRKKRIVQIGQGGTAALSLIIGVLLFADRLEFWHLLASAAVQSVIFSMMMPARQAMLPEVVGMQRLMNASAINMGGMNIMQMVAPALGGFLIGTAGAEWAYLVMTVFSLFALVALFPVPDLNPVEQHGRMPSAGAHGGRRGAGSLREIADGFTYIVHSPVLRIVLLSTLLLTLFTMPYQLMLPGFVLDVLDGDAKMLGVLQSVASIGALIGALIIASAPGRLRGRMLLAGGLVTGVALIAFSASTVVWMTALTMMVIGLGSTFRMSLSQVLVQTYVRDEYRGRVMSVYMMEMNLVSLGTFFTGLLAAAVGVQVALGALAVAMIAIVIALYTLSPTMRTID